MKKIVLFFLLFVFTNVKAQDNKDSVKTLQEVNVKAYEYNRRLIDVPAAVSIITNAPLNRFNNTNILQAINSNPGIHMEERSPGSYRLNIRGSSLRSPFGVRNVKVYYNNIPYTDPGGNTYFNQLGFYNFQNIEILKGPGSSLYGAGNGGVVLINSNSSDFHSGGSLNYSLGSFGLQNINLNIRAGNESAQNILNYQHQTSNGYREWIKMRRDIFSWDALIKTNKEDQLTAHFLYGDLFYQTPGALTKSEYDANPKASRPAVGLSPSAATAHAAIYQKMFLAGFSYTKQIISNFKNTTTVYGAYTSIKNPTFRNYEIRSEPHFGGRTIFTITTQSSKTKFNFNFGAEFQQGYNRQTDFGNRQSNPDTVQTDDLINNFQGFIFSQATLELSNNWIFTAGASLNKFNVDFRRISKTPSVDQGRRFNNQFTPRIAVLKKITADISIYASVSRGFSPPTTAEMLPSTGIISTNLNAEKGVNYEVGSRGALINNRLYFDINSYYFNLKNTIVQRRDATGADYFINAGSTKQTGIETYFSYQITENNSDAVNNAKVWMSYTLQDFHYKQFKQINADYSGKQLPGVAPNTFAAGADIKLNQNIYANITYYFSDKIALNDANTDHANAYHLLDARAGYKKLISKKDLFEIFAGADNILNQKYSLGNDINAAGGRYYNAAPTRNYFVGISFSLNKK